MIDRDQLREALGTFTPRWRYDFLRSIHDVRRLRSLMEAARLVAEGFEVNIYEMGVEHVINDPGRYLVIRLDDE